MTTDRFLSQDPFPGSHEIPGSLHRYLYGDGDPMNRQDPSGLFPWDLVGVGLVVGLFGVFLATAPTLFEATLILGVGRTPDTSPKMLPTCPCTVEDLKNDKNVPAGEAKWAHPWEGGTSGILSWWIFHPGSAFDYRRTGAGVSGQQCTYDSCGKLITGGPGAGTPDRYSPITPSLVTLHFLFDVVPWYQLGWQKYTADPRWAPQNERNCTPNFVIFMFGSITVSPY